MDNMAIGLLTRYMNFRISGHETIAGIRTIKRTLIIKYTIIVR